MKSLQKCVYLSLLWWVSIAALAQPCFGQTQTPSPLIGRPGFRAGEIIVKIRDRLAPVSRAMERNTQDTGSRNLDLLNQQFGVTKVAPVFQARIGRAFEPDSPLQNVMLLNLRQGTDEKTAMQSYASLEEVEYAELNYLYYVFATPNDPFFASQYALQSQSYQGIDAVDGWNLGQGSNSVIVAIVDTGIDYTHEDLAGKVIKGYDYVNEDFDPKDDHGHGTHVAGIVGAIANNSRGIAGVCPACSLLAVKVVGSDGSGSNSWIANGIANAASLGARVINLSLGGMDRSSTIQLAVQQAYAKGAVIVAASGNDGSGVTLYPAGFPEVIAVGATDKNGGRASFSNYGSHLDVAAPGQAIYSSLPGNRYEAWNGTSMAAPHVAGLAGLLFSKNPALTNVQVRQIMEATAQDLGAAGRDASFGYGRINVYAALNAASGGGVNYPAPTPVAGNPYPPAQPGETGACGPGLQSLFALTLFGLGWVNLARWKRRQ